MLKPKVQDALNSQLNAETFSSYLYLSMAAWFESKNFSGMANWMRIQAQEEMTHAMKFYNFINDRDGRILLAAIAQPRTDWNSPLDAFEDALQHERKVTGLINGLVKLSLEESDYAANAFLQWFVNEQVEEEANAVSIIEKLRLVGDNGVALFMLDNELGTRVFTPPAPPTGAD